MSPKAHGLKAWFPHLVMLLGGKKVHVGHTANQAAGREGLAGGSGSLGYPLKGISPFPALSALWLPKVSSSSPLWYLRLARDLRATNLADEGLKALKLSAQVSLFSP